MLHLMHISARSTFNWCRCRCCWCFQMKMKLVAYMHTHTAILDLPIVIAKFVIYYHNQIGYFVCCCFYSMNVLMVLSCSIANRLLLHIFNANSMDFRQFIHLLLVYWMSLLEVIFHVAIFCCFPIVAWFSFNSFSIANILSGF